MKDKKKAKAIQVKRFFISLQRSSKEKEYLKREIMNKKLNLLIGLVLICTQIYSQDLNFDGKHYYSEGIIPAMGLTKEQIVSIMNDAKFEGGIEDIIYENGESGFIIFKSKTVIQKDPIGRDVECWVYPKMYIKDSNMKIIIENFDIAFFSSMDKNARIIPKPIEETNLSNQEDVKNALTKLNGDIYKTVNDYLNSKKERYAIKE